MEDRQPPGLFNAKKMGRAAAFRGLTAHIKKFHLIGGFQ
jgi:hypothetical protein